MVWLGDALQQSQPPSRSVRARLGCEDENRLSQTEGEGNAWRLF